MRVKSQQVTTRLPVTIVAFNNRKEYTPHSPVQRRPHISSGTSSVITSSWIASAARSIFLSLFMSICTR